MLKQVLRANGASCGFFGALFVIAGPATAEFVGTPPVPLLQVLGAGLLVYAVVLVWASLQEKPGRLIVLAFALGDAIWVAATVALLIAGLWISTMSGIVWAVGIATFVGVCGVLQWKLAPIRA
jgi:hypothetical protein